MGAHTAALHPAHIDSDDDDDESTTTEMTAAHQLRRPRRHTLRQMQPQTPPVKCVSWHRTMGSRWYPADMGFFARAARTALLLWTRAQSAVETSPW